MEIFHVLLRKRERRIRSDFIYFLDALSLYLQAGFDLAYSWPQALEALRARLGDPCRQALSIHEGEGMNLFLTRLTTTYPLPQHRVWLSVLKELYAQGAPMNEAVTAIARTLRKEHERELQNHCKTLPTKINLLLLLFFLPPTLLLLFTPLLMEILSVV